MCQRKRGFTLVELLVVIGIIAVLVGMLLPSLNRAREQARRIQCLSNIRQIAMGFLMYTGENKGWFPAAAVFGGDPGLGKDTVHASMTPTWIGRAEDWIIWRGKAEDDPLEGAIIKYMNNPDPSVMRCPSDDVTTRAVVDPLGNYFYSYQMNSYLSFGAIYHPDAVPPRNSQYNPPNSGGWNNFRFKEDVAWKIEQVKNSSDKIIVYEADERVLRDGRGQLQSKTVGSNANNIMGMLAIRHDSKRTLPDTPPGGSKGPQSITVNENVDRRGNAGFVDGHGDYISRRDAHSRKHYGPKYVAGDPLE